MINGNMRRAKNYARRTSIIDFITFPFLLKSEAGSLSIEV